MEGAGGDPLQVEGVAQGAVPRRQEGVHHRHGLGVVCTQHGDAGHLLQVQLPQQGGDSLGCLCVLEGVGLCPRGVVGLPVPQHAGRHNALGLHGVAPLGQKVLAIQRLEKQGAQRGVRKLVRGGV